MKLRTSILAAAFLALAGSAALPAQSAGAEPAPLDAAIVTAPVELDGYELFRLRGVASYPAERRAADVVARLEALAADPSFAPADLVLVDSELGTLIQARGQRVFAITDADAELESIGRRQLAEVVVRRVREGLDTWRAERGRDSLLDAGKRAAVATVILLVSVFVVLRTWRRVVAALEARFERHVRSLAIGSFQFVRADRVQAWLRQIARTLRGLLLAGLVFFYLLYVLRLFPWTRGAGERLDDWTLGPIQTIFRGIAANIPNLLFIVILWVIIRWALGLVRLFFEAVGRGEVELGSFDRDWAEPTYKLVRTAIVAFAIIVAYPYIPGSESAAFKGVSLFLGVVFSLGSSSAIANIIAGYSMTYRGIFKEGDRVRIGEHTGFVTEIRLQITRLRTAKNESVTIPNSTILNSEVVNYSTHARDRGLILYTTVGIGYETPWRQVEAMLLEAAARTPGVLPDKPSFVLQKSLGDFAVTYELNVHVDDPTAIPRIGADLHRSVLDVFNEYGVQIMTPAYEGDPERPKVVARDKWYAAPARDEPAAASGSTG